MGQRLPARFGQSGAARELGLVQIVVEASAIRGGSYTLSHLILFLVGTVIAFWGTIERGCPSDHMDENIYKL